MVCFCLSLRPLFVSNSFTTLLTGGMAFSCLDQVDLQLQAAYIHIKMKENKSNSETVSGFLSCLWVLTDDMYAYHQGDQIWVNFVLWQLFTLGNYCENDMYQRTKLLGNFFVEKVVIIILQKKWLGPNFGLFPKHHLVSLHATIKIPLKTLQTKNRNLEETHFCGNHSKFFRFLDYQSCVIYIHESNYMLQLQRRNVLEQKPIKSPFSL
jgi:hypothetical protein